MVVSSKENWADCVGVCGETLMSCRLKVDQGDGTPWLWQRVSDDMNARPGAGTREHGT